MDKVTKLEKASAKAALTYFSFITVWLAALFYALAYLSPIMYIAIAASPIAVMVFKGIYIAFIAEVEEE